MAEAPGEQPLSTAQPSDAQPSDVQLAVRLAITGAGRGDSDSWQLGVERALALDRATADRIARAELAERVRRHQIAAGMVAEIVNGTTILASATEGGPFQCPAFLMELAVRRALDEPGCQDHVDEAELVYAATQCAGLLDLHDALLPPGWGWLISLPLHDTA